MSINARDEFVARYVSALEKEIEMQGKAYDNAVVRTVFFGGGTPSLLPPEDFSRIMRAVKNNFKTNFSEVTVECNPESLTQEKLEVFCCFLNKNVILLIICLFLLATFRHFFIGCSISLVNRNDISLY